MLMLLETCTLEVHPASEFISIDDVHHFGFAVHRGEHTIRHNCKPKRK